VGLGWAALLASVGLAMNRLDVGIFGYWHDAKAVYFPSLAEWALGLGTIAAAGLFFLFAAENFAVFDADWRERQAAFRAVRRAFDPFTRVWNAVLTSGIQRSTLIAVFVLPLAWVAMYPPYRAATPGPSIVPATGLDVQRANLRIDGDRAGVFTDFAHADHQKRLGADSSCTICHHVSMPGDRSTPCSRCHRRMVVPVQIFDHFHHMAAVAARDHLPGTHPANASCGVCHAAGMVKSAASATDCMECHRENMWIGAALPDTSVQLIRASSFERAMHGTCIACHLRQRDRVEKPALADCATCHVTLRRRTDEVATTRYDAVESSLAASLATVAR
jgi:hypothetical protein